MTETRKMFQEFTIVHATAFGWILSAGAYGFGAGKFGSEIPEYAAVYLLLGFGIGVGLSGSTLLMYKGEEK